MSENVTKKVALGTIALAILGLLVYGFARAWICKGIESSDAAGWMQAMGSVLAIAAAGYGIRAQLKHTETLHARTLAANQRNVLVSLIAELRVYQTSLIDIQDQINSCTSVVLCGTLQMVFPSTRFRFPIYVANTSSIWAISDDSDRTMLIGTYAELDMLFELIDRNSEFALAIPHNSVPTEETLAGLKGMYQVIQAQLDRVRPIVSDVISRLEAQVAPSSDSGA